MNRISIGSDNGLSPFRCQAIILTNAGWLSIGPLGTNFTDILIKIQNFPFTKTLSAKWRSFCSGYELIKVKWSSALFKSQGLLSTWMRHAVDTLSTLPALSVGVHQRTSDIYCHWKPKVVMMPTVLPLVTQCFVIMATSISEGNVRIPTTLAFFRGRIQTPDPTCDSLRPCDAIWRQRSWSTLAQVMACCLATPSHYLNQCWLFINWILWHSPKTNFIENIQDINSLNEFEKLLFKNSFHISQGPMS